MTDFSETLVADQGQSAITITLMIPAEHEAWLAAQPAVVRNHAAAMRFTGAAGQHLILPDAAGDGWRVIVAVASPESLDPWALAKLAEALPAGRYRLVRHGTGAMLPAGPAALGWLLAQHRFSRYRAADQEAVGIRTLLIPDVAARDEQLAMAAAVAMVRDLVNMPASDLGPAELADTAEALAQAHAARLRITKGEALEQGFPLIHAVGKAASKPRAPRLIELEWGNPAHPRLVIIGKGVCFDSGGLDIKPAAGMLLMKKDMGGAAHALALAQLIMGRQLPVRLHLLIAAVENAISAEAMRPGDIYRSRAGLHVEIGNTDAEGRLVLADAMAKAQESPADLMIDFATLTGAARVALGPDLPALFANDDAVAEALLAAGQAAGDPLWRLPLWAGYDEYLKSDVADVNNAGSSGLAGAITAALFLQRFVVPGQAWAHLDTFAWMPAAKPGRPKGGEALGLRAAWAMLKARYGGESG